MPAFIQTEVTAEAITEAMNDDGGFALEVWRELTQKLSAGMLFDDTCDIMAEIDPAEARKIADQFHDLSTAITERLQP